MLLALGLPAHAQPGRFPEVRILNPTNGQFGFPVSETLLAEFDDDESWRGLPARGFSMGPVGVGGVWMEEANEDGTFVSFSGYWMLLTNRAYRVDMWATDRDGQRASTFAHFDTFVNDVTVVEAEDYDFNGGRFVASPVLIPDGTTGPESYAGRVGVAGLDYSDTTPVSGPGINRYRPADRVGVVQTLDSVRPNFRAAGGPAAGLVDHDLVDVRSNEWTHYTRSFVAGVYSVHLRQRTTGPSGRSARLDRVQGHPTNVLGVVPLGRFDTVNEGTNYVPVALRGSPWLGSSRPPILIRLPEGETTLRLVQQSDDSTGSAIRDNALIIAREADVPAGELEPWLFDAWPPPGSRATGDTVTLGAFFMEPEKRLQIGLISLRLNSVTLPSVFVRTNGGLRIEAVAALVPGITNQVELRFGTESLNIQTVSWAIVAAGYPAPIVESAATLGGPFLEERPLVVWPVERRMRLPITGASWFYRLRHPPGFPEPAVRSIRAASEFEIEIHYGP